jgi:hypothetical protein
MRLLVGGHPTLGGHPNIAALNDELRIWPFFTQGICTFTYGNNPKVEKSLGYFALFHALTSILATENTTTFGAKCVCNSKAAARAVVATLQQYLRDVKVILMTRNDLVAQYGSVIVGNTSGLMHSWYKGVEDRKIPQITINKWLFINYVIKCLDINVVLSELRKTHEILECYYEDFLANQALVEKRVFDFLGVPQIEVTWLKSSKLMPAPEKYIRNYSDMRNLLERLRAAHGRGEISPMTIGFARSFVRIHRILDIKGSWHKWRRETVDAARREGWAKSLAMGEEP